MNSHTPKQATLRLARSLQRGVTLIELMVALVLALLIIAAVGYVYLQGSQGFRVQDSQSRMQEDARFIIDTVGRDVRVAGSFGCNLPRETGTMLSGRPSTSIEFIASQPIMTKASVGTGWLMTSGDDTTPADRFMDLQYVLRGFSPTAAATAIPLPSYIQGTGRQPGTDVLMVMRSGEDAKSVVSSTETTLTMDGYLTPANKEYPVLAVSDCRETKIIKPTMTGASPGPVLLEVKNGMNKNNNAPSGQVDELRAAFGKSGTPTVSHFEPVLYYVAAPTANGLRSSLHRVGIANDAGNWGGWEGTGGAIIASGVESFNLSFVLSGDPATPKEFSLADMETGAASRWAAVSAVRLQFTLSAEGDGTALTAQSNVAGGPARTDKRLVQRYDVTLGVSSRQNPRN